MASQKTEHQRKTGESSKTPKKGELTSGDLDKVVGGLKKNIGIGAPKPVAVIGDPCEGGQ